MMTLLLLLALVLLLVYAGWLWTAPRVPGVREAGLVELLMSVAAGVLVGSLLSQWFGWLRRPRPAFRLRRGGRRVLLLVVGIVCCGNQGGLPIPPMAVS